MSAPFIVPFDNNPAAISVKTASYTIPAGKFARCVVNLEGSATFTIGGVTALRGTQNSILSSMVAPAFGGAIATTATGPNTTYPLGSFGTTDQKTLTSEVWVPTGTVISGTGTFRIIVTEYNVIS